MSNIEKFYLAINTQVGTFFPDIDREYNSVEDFESTFNSLSPVDKNGCCLKLFEVTLHHGEDYYIGDIEGKEFIKFYKKEIESFLYPIKKVYV